MRPPATAHRLVVCTTCRPAAACAPNGLLLVERLRAAFATGDPAGFEVDGFPCMACCTRPCTAAFVAPGKHGYLFGDIDPRGDIEPLLAFARLYALRPDGFTRSAERPPELRGRTVARLPPAATGGGGS